jgi:hypothetical protein
MAQDIGEWIREVFATGSDLQKEFFSTWTKSSKDVEASSEEYAKGLSELAQRFWTDLASNLYHRPFFPFGNHVDPEELAKSQEESLSMFAENMRKLTEAYFTASPLAMFGKSLEFQKLLSGNGGMFGWPAGLDAGKHPERPSRTAGSKGGSG